MDPQLKYATKCIVELVNLLLKGIQKTAVLSMLFRLLPTLDSRV